jgi:hypothetical protein
MDIKKEVKKYLIDNSDQKLAEFEKKLNMKNNETIHLGVKVPILRNYAKELSKKHSIDYLYNNIDEEYYEELMLKGFIIDSYTKISFEELNNYINDFVPKIYDWGICDTFCAGLKITKKYLKEIWNLINKYLNSNNEFEVRFSLVMMLDHYLIDDYIDKIFDIVSNVKLDKYYVKMANAWLISFMLIKYFDKTMEYLKKCQLDDWTYNKALQKALESYRIKDEDKALLRKLKRKGDRSEKA